MKEVTLILVCGILLVECVIAGNMSVDFTIDYIDYEDPNTASLSYIEDEPTSPSPFFTAQASGTTGRNRSIDFILEYNYDDYASGSTGRTAEKTGGLLTLFLVFWNNWC